MRADFHMVASDSLSKPSFENHRNRNAAFNPFADAKPRLSRRGREARLRVNPEQAPAFMPGSRGVD
ncbi:MAG: hypothetical protein MUQ00_17515, partial [Candidatus Aminicenantes bacterium]|nr:hypothetical protein [Candidatus Aminicenantes bacterium]